MPTTAASTPRPRSRRPYRPAVAGTPWARAAVVAAGLTLLLSSALAQSGPAPADPAPEGDPVLERRLLAETNEARRAHGLDPLVHDPGLARAARAHAAENAVRGVLDHGSPDPDRATVGMRVAEAGVALVEVGENLARMPGPEVAGPAVAGWLASPSHRRNLLNDAFSHVGFGTAVGADGTYVAQVFGARPLARAEAFADRTTEATVAWAIELDGPPGEETMTFLDERPAEAVVLGPDGRADLHLDVPAGTVPRLDLGVRVDDVTYRRSDRIVLDPDGWRRPGAIAPGSSRFAEARATPRTRTIVRFELRYLANGAALVLYADGTHRPDAEIEDGTARLSVPADQLPSELGVAILDGPSRARMVERFTVVPGDPPSLRPGRPSIVLEDAP